MLTDLVVGWMNWWIPRLKDCQMEEDEEVLAMNEAKRERRQTR